MRLKHSLDDWAFLVCVTMNQKNLNYEIETNKITN